MGDHITGRSFSASSFHFGGPLRRPSKPSRSAARSPNTKSPLKPYNSHNKTRRSIWEGEAPAEPRVRRKIPKTGSAGASPSRQRIGRKKNRTKKGGRKKGTQFFLRRVASLSPTLRGVRPVTDGRIDEQVGGPSSATGPPEKAATSASRSRTTQDAEEGYW